MGCPVPSLFKTMKYLIFYAGFNLGLNLWEVWRK